MAINKSDDLVGMTPQQIIDASYKEIDMDDEDIIYSAVRRVIVDATWLKVFVNGLYEDTASEADMENELPYLWNARTPDLQFIRIQSDKTYWAHKYDEQETTAGMVPYVISPLPVNAEGAQVSRRLEHPAMGEEDVAKLNAHLLNDFLRRHREEIAWLTYGLWASSPEGIREIDRQWNDMVIDQLFPSNENRSEFSYQPVKGRSYVYVQEDENMGKSHLYMGNSRTRDSRDMDLALYEHVNEMVKDQCGGSDYYWDIRSFSHWACGWLERTAIRVLHEPGHLDTMTQLPSWVLEWFYYTGYNYSNNPENMQFTYEHVQNLVSDDLMEEHVYGPARQYVIEESEFIVDKALEMARTLRSLLQRMEIRLSLTEEEEAEAPNTVEEWKDHILSRVDYHMKWDERVSRAMRDLTQDNQGVDTVWHYVERASKLLDIARLYQARLTGDYTLFGDDHKCVKEKYPPIL